MIIGSFATYKHQHRLYFIALCQLLFINDATIHGDRRAVANLMAVDGSNLAPALRAVCEAVAVLACSSPHLNRTPW